MYCMDEWKAKVENREWASDEQIDGSGLHIHLHQVSEGHLLKITN